MCLHLRIFLIVLSDTPSVISFKTQGTLLLHVANRMITYSYQQFTIHFINNPFKSLRLPLYLVNTKNLRTLTDILPVRNIVFLFTFVIGPISSLSIWYVGTTVRPSVDRLQRWRQLICLICSIFCSDVGNLSGMVF